MPFIPWQAIAPRFPIEEYADPAQQQAFTRPTREAISLAAQLQPYVNMEAPIPFCGMVDMVDALAFSGNLYNGPQSADPATAPYAAPKGSSVFAWLVNAAKALPITPTDAGA